MLHPIRGALLLSTALLLVACGGDGANDVVEPTLPPPVGGGDAPPPSGGDDSPPAGGGDDQDPPADPDPDDPPGASTTISGIAAVGAALDGASVTVRDATGTLLELGDILTGADGSYQVAVPADTPLPLLIEVTPPEGEPLRTVVPESAPGEPITANVNPLTELVTNELVGEPSEDPAAIGSALAPVAADPASVDATGDAVVGALLGGDLDYETFASDPDFVADSGGDETPSVTDTLLDTLETTAEKADQPLAEFLEAQLDAPEPAKLIEAPAFQVRYVGELIEQGNDPEDIEDKLEDTGAITALEEGETTDVFRQAIVAVPALIDQTNESTTSLDDAPELKAKAAEAAVEALASLVEERAERFGDTEDDLEEALASAEVINTVTEVVAEVVTPVLEAVAERDDLEDVEAALDEVLEETSEAAGQTLSAFSPDQLETTDVTDLATAHLQQNVIAQDTADQLDAISAGTISAEELVQTPDDVTDTGAALQTLLEEDSTLISGGDADALIEAPPPAWNVDNWNEFNWS